MSDTISWRRLDLPGFETCRLVRSGEGWNLRGAVLLVHEGKSCRLDYAVRCDAQWQTQRAVVHAWIGDEDVKLTIDVADSRWIVNGEEVESVAGCIDIDLGFTPSTNLLPIRRLGLEIGEDAEVNAAWLPFPELRLRSLDQRYSRLGQATYRYESRGGRFVREISVDSDGLVLDYPGIWERVA